jgi:hypothetical protein
MRTESAREAFPSAAAALRFSLPCPLSFGPSRGRTGDRVEREQGLTFLQIRSLCSQYPGEVDPHGFEIGVANKRGKATMGSGLGTLKPKTDVFLRKHAQEPVLPARARPNCSPCISFPAKLRLTPPTPDTGIVLGARLVHRGLRRRRAGSGGISARHYRRTTRLPKSAA